MDKLIFGLKVKTLREHRKLTQAKLAEMIDISDINAIFSSNDRIGETYENRKNNFNSIYYVFQIISTEFFQFLIIY